MPCFDINQVFISYIDLMDPTVRRIEHLYKHYYFTCQVRVLLYSVLQSAEYQALLSIFTKKKSLFALFSTLKVENHFKQLHVEIGFLIGRTWNNFTYFLSFFIQQDFTGQKFRETNIFTTNQIVDWFHEILSNLSDDGLSQIRNADTK